MPVGGKIGILILPLVLLSLAWKVRGGEDTSLFSGAVRELEAYFPAVEGMVVSTAGDTIFTDIPESKGLKPGSELFIVRVGTEILHPLTRKPLGRYETVLGIIRVSQVRPAYTAGEVLRRDPAEEIRPGDRIRITSSRLRALVVMLPPAVREAERWQTWKNELFFNLENSPRFYPLESREEKEGGFLDSPQSVKEYALRAGAELLIVLEQSGSGGLALRLFSGLTGYRVATAAVSDTGAAEGPSEPGRKPAVPTAPAPASGSVRTPPPQMPASP